MKRIRFQFCFVMLVSFATFLGVAFGEGANRQHNLFDSFAAQDAASKTAQENVLSANISAPEVARIAEKTATVSINPDFFEASKNLRLGDTVLMNLFNGEQTVLKIQAVETDVNHVTTIRGPVHGSALDFFYISIDGDKLLLTLDKITTGRKFQVIFNRQTGAHTLYDIPLDRFEMPNGDLSPTVPPSFASGKKMSEEIAAAVSASDPNEEVTIDVMIVYTQEAREWADANGGINSIINQAMAMAQQVLDNSKTFLKIKLVHSSFVAYSETKNCNTDIVNLAGVSDKQIDEVHVLRQAYGADLVSMFVSELEGVYGCGYSLMAEDMPNGISNRAFSVVEIENAADAPRYSFIHELGHNMGAGHHKEQNVEHGPQVYTYSAGWRWVGSDTNRYCSVMSYTEGFSDGQTYARVPYFSNPSISHLGAATGNAVDGDNARTIRETKHLTATYSSEWTNGQAANLVLGQSNFSSGSGGAGAGNMYHPDDVAVDWATGKIFVADAWNNRVLRFASGVTLMTGASAEAVLGQPDFNTTASGTTAKNMSYPTGIFSDPAGHLWVADAYNNRVLRFDNAATKASGAAADGVLGQADFTSSGKAVAQNRMNFPEKVAVEAGRLWVSDHANHRVLRFDNAATKTNGADADGVLGQPDFTSNDYATARNRMYWPS